MTFSQSRSERQTTDYISEFIAIGMSKVQNEIYLHNHATEFNMLSGCQPFLSAFACVLRGMR